MPRKNAGYTGRPSRNPKGRGAEFDGPKRGKSYYLTVTALDRVRALADELGCSQNAVVERMARVVTPMDLQLVSVLAQGADDADADAGAVERMEAAGAVPGAGA